MNQPLAETIFWVGALACALGQIAILRSTIAHRRAQNSRLIRASSPVSELIWAVVPAVALSILLLATWNRIQARSSHTRMPYGPHQMSLAAFPGAAD